MDTKPAEVARHLEKADEQTDTNGSDWPAIKVNQPASYPAYD